MPSIRNLAIIAHVDHGKTTLVDAMLRQSGVFRANQQVAERIMDRFDLERERGITILSKNTAVLFRETKINIVDTPGHADFGGEVERVLSMVDGALLVVDAVEGPMPQTRYVLRKALEGKLTPIVFINKVDRTGARPKRVADEVLDLFIELGAEVHQIDFPVLYGSGKQGVAGTDPGALEGDLLPLFRTIVEAIPAPAADMERPGKLLVSSIDYDDYQGRILLGKVRQGMLEAGRPVVFGRSEGEMKPGKISRIYTFDGLRRVEAPSAPAGDIVAISGLGDAGIGDTIADPEDASPLPAIEVDEPTLTMTFRVNDSPFAGREGKYVTSRQLGERLRREVERNVALKVEDTGSPDMFQVSGRGELHLSILLETMRREGYELAVSKPEVIRRTVGGKVLEPFEELTVDAPEDQMGVIMEAVLRRKGELKNLVDGPPGSRRFIFLIPARGLVGLRSELLSETKGQAIMHHVFAGYDEDKGPIPGRQHGSLVASEEGEATTYALHHLSDRGTFFIEPKTHVYAGMVVGEHTREKDLELNVAKKKHVTNMRSSTAEETLRLSPPHLLSLEEALEFLAADELLEITPERLRIRKMELDPHRRARAAKQAVTAAEGKG